MPAELLEPILVCGTGRGGTTLTMQLLATSPRIAMHREYVYEHHYYRYLVEWAALPFRERWDGERWHVGALVFPHVGALADGLMGPLPWQPRDLVDDPDELARAWFRAAWREFSRVAGRGDARYYAEKCDRVWALPDWIKTRTLALVRDPRDTWLSVLAFDARRGYHGFGRRPGEPEDDYLERFLDEQREHLAWAASAGDEALVVHYEALVADLPAQVSRIGDWLGLELDAAAVTAARDTVAHHITAASPEASAGRWRAALAPERRARFAERLGAQLEALGYEP